VYGAVGPVGNIFGGAPKFTGRIIDSLVWTLYLCGRIESNQNMHLKVCEWRCLPQTAKSRHMSKQKILAEALPLRVG